MILSLFTFATLGLASVSFAQPSEQELKDYIKQTCGNNDPECVCIVNQVAPHFPSIEIMDKINRGQGSAQDNQKINGLIADINKQCGTDLTPIPIEEK